MGRPAKYSPAVSKRICAALEHGASYALAAAAGGIHRDTLNEWMKQYPDFSDAVRAAEQRAAERALAAIMRACAESDWRAGAWLLERRWPEDYGRRDGAPAAGAGGDRGRLRIEYTREWRRSDGERDDAEQQQLAEPTVVAAAMGGEFTTGEIMRDVLATMLPAPESEPEPSDQADNPTIGQSDTSKSAVAPDPPRPPDAPAVMMVDTLGPWELFKGFSQPGRAKEGNT